MKAEHIGCHPVTWMEKCAGWKETALRTLGWLQRVGSGGTQEKWPSLPSHSDLSLLTASGSSLKMKFTDDSEWRNMTNTEHKQRNNLKELGKWERQGQKCESSWKNANGYVWGQIIHKPDIHWAGNFWSTLRLGKLAVKWLLLTVAETMV